MTDGVEWGNMEPHPAKLFVDWEVPKKNKLDVNGYLPSSIGWYAKLVQDSMADLLHVLDC